MICSVCQRVVQQRYGFSNGTLSSTRSLTPQTLANINIHPINPLSQQQSPGSNQIRLIQGSQNVSSGSFVPGNISLAQTTSPSMFSTYQTQHEQQPILVPPTQSFSNSSNNGILKDRNNQQQQSQVPIDKRTRSFKEPLPVKLSTVNETHALSVHEGQVRLNEIKSEQEHASRTISL